jgi:hypothetical protein
VDHPMQLSSPCHIYTAGKGCVQIARQPVNSQAADDSRGRRLRCNFSLPEARSSVIRGN